MSTLSIYFGPISSSLLRNPPNLQMYKITHNEISGTNFDLKKKRQRTKTEAGYGLWEFNKVALIH